MSTASLRAPTGVNGAGGVYHRTCTDGANVWYVANADGSTGESWVSFTSTYELFGLFLDLSTNEKMTSLSLQLPFVMGNGLRPDYERAQSVTFYAFLYDSAHGSESSLPSNPLSSCVVTQTINLYSSGSSYVTFNFTGLNLDTQSRTPCDFYIWFKTNIAPSAYNQCYCALKHSWNKTETVTGTFETKAPTLTFGATTYSTDDTYIRLRMTGVTAGDTIRIKYGSTELASMTATEAITEWAIPGSSAKQWFTTAGVTTLPSMTVTASIDGYATITASCTLTAGSNMKPTVASPDASIVQTGDAATYFPDTYIAGISKAKISAQVTAGSNAEIRTVTLSYGTTSVPMVYNSETGKYEATTSAPVTGNTMFTVTATDARGLSGSSVYGLAGVVSYTMPSAVIDSAATYRCNSSGTEQAGGPYVRVKATATYDTNLSGNELVKFLFRVREDGTSRNLTSGVQTAAVRLISPSPDSAITVEVIVQDKISGEVSRMITLAASHKDVVAVSHDGKISIGIGHNPVDGVHGRATTTTYVDNVDLTTNGLFSIEGRDLTTFYRAATKSPMKLGFDFLAIDADDLSAEVNQAAEINTASVSSWTNMPSTLASASAVQGIRFPIMAWRYVMMVFIEKAPVRGRIWVNFGEFSGSSFNTVTWAGWKGITPDI